MDTWWNAASEFQAADRVYRIGQHRPVTVLRYVMRGTVEERVLALQQKKLLVSAATVGNSNAALGKLTEQDVKFLFS